MRIRRAMPNQSFVSHTKRDPIVSSVVARHSSIVGHQSELTAMKLTEEQLLQVIAVAPLVSIDLVIRDAEARILMGRRVNKPAQGKWFVPGGRVYKNESLDDAFERITMAEIGLSLSRNDASLLGPFTHLYDDNFMCAEGISTHYVVLAYELGLTKPFNMQKSKQHSEFAWFAPDDINPDIHKNSLEYFKHPSPIDKVQYGVLNARRDNFNNLLWQTPILSLTAQAFLFSTILSTEVSLLARQLASALSFVISLASMQLLVKHRFMEEQHAKILDRYEGARGLFRANGRFSPNTWSTRIKSHVLWAVLLGLFAVAAAFAFLFPELFTGGQANAPSEWSADYTE